MKLQKSTKYNVTTNTIVGSKNYLSLNDLVELKGSKPTGSKDYITLDENYLVSEGQLTINGYVIIIKNGEITSVNKGDKIEIESMILNHTEETMEKGSSFKLEPIFIPDNASNQEVTYVSSDENIIEVDEDGNVTAKNIGNAKVIVTSEDKTSIKAECNIEVIVTATGVTVTPSESEIKIGETLQLTGTLIPSDVTSNALVWTSSDNNIALVDENGLVTGISKGEVTITATTVNGLTSTSKITVKEILAESITLNKTSATIEKGNTVQLSATVSPSNTTNKTVTWTSSDESVATVDSTGLVTSKGAGTTTITASTSNGKTATSEITVVISATGISLDKTSASIEKGSTLQLTATVAPSDATDKSITWTSSNTSVATVDNNGLVTAKGAGSITITAKTSNGKTATSSITVTPQTFLLSSKVSVGDYVAYDAGVWTETVAKPTNQPASQGNFGGYTSGQNKANSVSWCHSSTYATTLKGWRVLSISGTTVTLVHAGHPECYYHSSTYSDSSGSISVLNNRATSQYLNSDYAQSAHMLNYDEALAITGSIDATTNDLRYIGQVGTTDKNPLYWLATALDDKYLRGVNTKGNIVNNGGTLVGVRPVIVLKAGIKTTGKGIDMVGQEAWILVKP